MSPWFMFCGCPTNKDRRGGPMGIHSPRGEGREFEWEPESRGDPDPDGRGNMHEDIIGAPSTAGRDTAAQTIKVKPHQKSDTDVDDPFMWRGATVDLDQDNDKKL